MNTRVLISSFVLATLVGGSFTGCKTVGDTTSQSVNTLDTTSGVPSSGGPTGAPAGTGSSGSSGGPVGPLSAVWANDGGDKVTQEDRRATTGGAGSVVNSVWDGSRVRLFAGRNEVVSFNLVLEAGATPLTQLGVTFDTLTGPGGFTIASTPATGNGVFTWTGRNIELFLVRYLQIKGLSRLSYETYDERHIPKRMRRPFTGAGYGTGTWSDRPDHDKFYPDIAVPLEVVSNRFGIAANQNQSVWADIYVPKGAPSGIYTGKVVLSQNGTSFSEIPVELEVKTFTLPDVATAKTMLFLGYADVGNRYVGEKYPNPGTANDTLLKTVRDRHFQMARRHKISMVDADPGSTASPGDRPRDEWVPRLDGSLFTAARGYAGPGEGVGNGVYIIGAYESWGWRNQGEAEMRSHSDAWVNWFAANSPSTEYFLYLDDEPAPPAQEPDAYPNIVKWTTWIKDNPGPGRNLPSFVTISLPEALSKFPLLSISASWFTVGDTSTWNGAYASAKAATPAKKIYMYNGKRPSNGSFATEDDGVAPRELAWAHYKKGVDRWYFWESTYYNDYQGGRGETNVFQTAQTFGAPATPDAIVGRMGWNHSNGDGVLFYPGTDRVFPNESYGVAGPLASLRLKHWRRGIQDVDYIALAKAVNPTLTQAVLGRMVPKALWDYGVSDPGDPSWVRSDISWSIDPNDWENARKDLADIIEGKTVVASALHVVKFPPKNPRLANPVYQAVVRKFSALKKIKRAIMSANAKKAKAVSKKTEPVIR